MTSTTFSFAAIEAAGDYAAPYGLNALGDFTPITMDLDADFLVPNAPAGAAWSNVLDMARYLITELHEGVAPTLSDDIRGVEHRGHAEAEPGGHHRGGKLTPEGLLPAFVVERAGAFGEVALAQEFVDRLGRDPARDHGRMDAFAGQRIGLAGGVADEQKLAC